MNIEISLTTVVVVCGIISLLIFLFGVGITILFQAIIVKEIAKIPELVSRVHKIEHLVQTMSTNIQMGQMEESFNQILKDSSSPQQLPPGLIAGSSGNGKILYRSADGKHTASSLEELFEKMVQDPTSGINKHDLESLKKLFEQINQEIQPEEETDEDDEEDWKKDK